MNSGTRKAGKGGKRCLWRVEVRSTQQMIDSSSLPDTGAICILFFLIQSVRRCNTPMPIICNLLLWPFAAGHSQSACR